jgi:hypothetical protein
MWMFYFGLYAETGGKKRMWLLVLECIADQVDRRQCGCLTGFERAADNVDPHITTLKQWDQTEDFLHPLGFIGISGTNVGVVSA